MEDKNQRPPNLGPDRDPDRDENPNAFFSGRGIWLLLLLFLGVFLAFKYFQYPAGETIPYSELKQKVKQGVVFVISVTFGGEFDVGKGTVGNYSIYFFCL